MPRLCLNKLLSLSVTLTFIVLCSLNYGQANYKKSATQLTLGERVQQLTELSKKRPVIRLNAEKFKQYVRASPRNYSFIIMFTALSPHRQCSICSQANEEFQIVASSFQSLAYTNRLFFGLVDYDEGPEVFAQLKQNSAPVFLHFSEKGPLKKGDQMDIQRIGFGADSIARWIAERTEVQRHSLGSSGYTRARMQHSVLGVCGSGLAACNRLLLNDLGGDLHVNRLRHHSRDFVVFDDVVGTMAELADIRSFMLAAILFKKRRAKRHKRSGAA
ncbi:secreted salivary gland peptide, putative [Ixodes scapularis]|uniref:Secreted salivary gland peptide, putative n=1 Tax=Ixodes scapularis TaxID=6945 RepID=B7PDF6_IXOSC|nr:secreted salivary gland peptide, putative [Ixodes scapularis]|eukprot:XP_002410790.1 secreted salivary gland peptide, putative [Ixodes scapularis]